MTTPEHPVYFISDLHLDAVFSRNNPHKAVMDSFFRHVRDNAQSLFILGDYFDFWFEYRSVVPSRSLYGLHRLMDLLEHNVRIYFLAGNHDGWGGRFLKEELNIPVFHDPQVIECPPHRVLLLHGDGLRSGDFRYRCLKYFIRHPVNQWLYKFLHPDIGVPLARLTSRISRNQGPEDFDESADPGMNRFYEREFSRGVDMIMMGHNHRPSNRLIRGRSVMVLGDWIRHFSYAVYDGATIKLEYWKESIS